ncbi:amidohydrolase family protein [Streptomyces sp. NPDC006285]|uniref:amidohydrolase family protein n=1 Tax=Streptomyces sp. NPDC006285 TaxID=3364742 RepID=UPI0036C568D9
MTALIDVHAHFVTDRYVEEAKAAGHVHPDGMPTWPKWTPETHLALMDRCGIDRSMLSVSSPGTHFGDVDAARSLSRAVNEYAAEVRQQHPERFGHFASLPLPDVRGSLEEAAYALDVLGADGLVVETNAHGAYPGDPRFKPLWEALDVRRAVVFVHPTSPPHAEDVSLGRPRPLMEFLFDSARCASDLILNGVLTRYPGIRWIFSHAGGVLPLLADRMQLFADLFSYDASPDGASPGWVRDRLARLWFDIAGTPFPRHVPTLVDVVGSGRLLYGSDYCWTPPSAVAAQIASIDEAVQPPDDTWRELTARNAHRLLGR